MGSCGVTQVCERFYTHNLTYLCISDMRTQSYFVTSTNSLLVTTTTHRSQAQNVEESLRKVC